MIKKDKRTDEIKKYDQEPLEVKQARIEQRYIDKGFKPEFITIFRNILNDSTDPRSILVFASTEWAGPHQAMFYIKGESLQIAAEQRGRDISVEADERWAPFVAEAKKILAKRRLSWSELARRLHAWRPDVLTVHSLRQGLPRRVGQQSR